MGQSKLQTKYEGHCNLSENKDKHHNVINNIREQFPSKQLGDNFQ